MLPCLNTYFWIGSGKKNSMVNYMALLRKMDGSLIEFRPHGVSLDISRAREAFL
jgi:hypothetical protein